MNQVKYESDLKKLRDDKEMLVS